MSKPEGPECYIPRLEMTMKEIPEKYHEALWEITGRGTPPSAVQAAVSYIEGECTQEDAADAFGVTKVTVRKLTRDLIDMGVVDIEYVRRKGSRDGDGRFGRWTVNGDTVAWTPPKE